MELDGRSLTIEGLVASARGAAVRLADDGVARMQAARIVIEDVIKERRPVYGVTTGLGAKSVEALDHETLANFSVQTLRGRAHAIGPSDNIENIRAGLIVRLNTLLSGHSGARVAVADHIAQCLNAGITPVVGQIGSIGASDLVINATVGLALIGEGQMSDPGGVAASEQMMSKHRIEPLNLAPRDGLALANHTGAVAGAAALAFSEAQLAFYAAQTTACLSLEGFRANLSPFDPRALAVKPLPGQQSAATDLMQRLAGSALFDPDVARRLQDPLSLRNIPQIHGGVQLALDQARPVIEIELNGASDNPLTFAETGDVLSGGAYFTTELGLVCEGISRAIVHMAMAQIARIAKLLTPDFSGLPLFLACADTGSNGFAPLMKTAEAVLAELVHSASAVSVWPSLNANGVEDCMSSAPVAVRALAKVASLSQTLTAIEAIVAAQAVNLRRPKADLGPFMAEIHKKIRSICLELTHDRPLTQDVETLTAAIADGAFNLAGENL